MKYTIIAAIRGYVFSVSTDNAMSAAITAEAVSKANSGTEVVVWKGATRIVTYIDGVAA